MTYIAPGTRIYQEFDRFQLFTTIGYQGASNSREIVEGFFADQPFADNTNLFDELLDGTKKPARPTLLYLKAQTATEASNRLTRKVVTAAIAYAEIFLVHVGNGHPDAVILNLDYAAIGVETNIDDTRIGVPGVSDRLSQHRRDVAVEIDAQVIQDIQIDGHLVG